MLQALGGFLAGAFVTIMAVACLAGLAYRAFVTGR
jgi:hypothetical protein